MIALQETVGAMGTTRRLTCWATTIRWYGIRRARRRRGAALGSRWPFGAVGEIDLHVTARVDLPSALPWAAVVAEVDCRHP